jgi:hypothetical protein
VGEEAMGVSRQASLTQGIPVFASYPEPGVKSLGPQSKVFTVDDSTWRYISSITNLPLG